ncbi:SGNH/GDSL hydrolase family protein [Pseudomonadota bacterium]
MAKKAFFYLIMFGFMLLLLEGFAYVVYLLTDRDDLFDHREGVLARLNNDGLADFRENRGDSVLGWENRGPLSSEVTNCRGDQVSYIYDHAGARTNGLAAPGPVEIVIVGDSYTHGDEVNYDESYPARLASYLGVSVVNHGVGGYGPTQSFLNLERRMPLYPDARVVILGIMYENLYRMMNAYRPVLYDTSSDYTLKPYMHGGEIHPHPGQDTLENLEHFKLAAGKAFDNDFWAKPQAGFPYSLALFKGIGSNYFYYRKLQKQLRNLGMQEYALAFESDDIQLNLVSLLNKFADYAGALNLKPVAIFIPRNRYDTRSATRFIKQNLGEFHNELVIGDVAGLADIDWQVFNTQEEEGDNICHPSPYGYAKIAEYIAGLLKQNGIYKSDD